MYKVILKFFIHLGHVYTIVLEDVFTGKKWYNERMKKDYLERQSYPTDPTDEQWAVIFRRCAQFLSSRTLVRSLGLNRGTFIY